MRNPTYALSILLCAALLLALAGCDNSTSVEGEYPKMYVYIMNTNGDNIQKLFQIGTPQAMRINGDGTQLLYKNYSGGLSRYTVATNDACSLSVPFDEYDFWPVYDKMFVLGRTSSNWDMYEMDIFTEAIEQLTFIQAPSSDCFHIAFQRNEIYYSAQEDTVYSLNRMNLDTRTVEALASNTYDRYHYPAVAPDGGAVYYFHDAETDSLNGLNRLDITTSSIQYFPFCAVCDRLGRLSIGFDEKFMLLRDHIVWLDENHQPVAGEATGDGVQLLNDQQTIVYEYIVGVYVWDILNDDPSKLTPGLAPWVSPVGDFIVFKRNS